MQKTYVTIFFCSFFWVLVAQSPQELIWIDTDDYSYTVLIPNTWEADSENAVEIMCDVVFFPTTTTLETALENGEPIIQVLAFEKKDENTIQDLDFDLAQLEKEYVGVKFDTFNVPHSSYKTFSKIAFVEGDFYQYLTYINPSEAFSNAISVTMNIAKHPATEAQLRAFRAVVASLNFKNE